MFSLSQSMREKIKVIHAEVAPAAEDSLSYNDV
jgi:hypothetical protein